MQSIIERRRDEEKASIERQKKKDAIAAATVSKDSVVGHVGLSSTTLRSVNNSIDAEELRNILQRELDELMMKAAEISYELWRRGRDPAYSL